MSHYFITYFKMDINVQKREAALLIDMPNEALIVLDMLFNIYTRLEFLLMDNKFYSVKDFFSKEL